MAHLGPRSAGVLRAALLASICVVASIRPAGAEPGLLIGYGIATWNEEDGLPSSALWAMTQSSDGDLWVGTESGLVRFDGLRFSTWDGLHENRLPTDSVRALTTDIDGNVWAGYNSPGGVTRIGGRQIRNYGESEGLPKAAIAMLYEHPTDGIWAGTLAGLFALSGDRWRRVDSGLPEGAAVFAATVIDGTTMVGTANGVYQRTAGSKVFDKIDSGVVRTIVPDPSGVVWVSDPVGGFRRLFEHPRSGDFAAQGRGNRLLFDRRGGLWIGNRAQGLWRTQVVAGQQIGPLEKATTLTGLSNDGVEAILEDLEGNVWVATSAGLNRLTPHKVTQVTDVGLVRGIEFAPNGSAWIGTVDAVVGLPDADIRRARRRITLPGSNVLAMHADPAGHLWVATTDGLLRLDADHKPVMQVPAGDRPSAVRALSSDADGGLWIADGEQGLMRWHGGHLEHHLLPPELASLEVLSVYVSRRQHVWVAFADGRVADLDPKLPPVIHGHVGLTTNQYRVFFEGSDGVMWLGGTERLGRVRAGLFEELSLDVGLPAGPVDAIAEDDHRAVWVAIFAVGIARITRPDLDAGFNGQAHPLHMVLYDRSDGVAGTPQGYTVTCGARSADGRLWFVTGRGLTVIDPRLIDTERRTVSPDVRLDSVLADGQPVSIVTTPTLPPRVARLEVDYSVLNLTSPLKSRFKYRLQGFDKDWVDAGRRRQAVYTNLPPGAYTFRVITSEDRDWSKSGVVWAFSIAPAFYQTGWFLAACACGLALAVGGAWRFHLIETRRRFELVLSERARLSREIHDTLLQSMVGLSLQVDAIGGDLDAAPTMSKERLLRLRTNLNEYIREARQSIRNLRSPMLEQVDLEQALRRTGEYVTAGTAIAFSLNVVGAARRCPAAIEEQLLRIGQEAITNALRHAGAQDICVELTYDAAAVAVRVVDNGSGFDLARVCEDRGHLGMTSMKERAETFGGLFSLRSVIGKGTEVHAVIPSPQ